MRISKIELAGRPEVEGGMPRAYATLTNWLGETYITAEVFRPATDATPEGVDSNIDIPEGDLRTMGLSPLARKRLAKRDLWRERNAACETLADMLDGDRNNWKSYATIIEQMVALG